MEKGYKLKEIFWCNVCIVFMIKRIGIQFVALWPLLYSLKMVEDQNLKKLCFSFKKALLLKIQGKDYYYLFNF